ncbi:MAG: hemerythrin domain-containing protein [Acidimicrobiia bacterium]
MCDHCGCRAFAPIAELTEEHERILAMAWALAEAAGNGADPPADEAEALLALLQVHAAKEERGLYPELVELGELSGQDRGLLEHEHRALRGALEAGAFDRHHYYELANHIEVEETELFSAARFAFEEPEWDAMAAAHLDLDRRLEALDAGSGT